MYDFDLLVLKQLRASGSLRERALSSPRAFMCCSVPKLLSTTSGGAVKAVSGHRGRRCDAATSVCAAACEGGGRA